MLTTEYSPERVDPIPENHPLEGGHRRLTQCGCNIHHCGLDAVPNRKRRPAHGGPDLRGELGTKPKAPSPRPASVPKPQKSPPAGFPTRFWEAAFLILFQIFAASEASCEKFPVTKSISRSTGARITFFQQFKGAGSNLADSPTRCPAGYFSHSPTKK